MGLGKQDACWAQTHTEERTALRLACQEADRKHHFGLPSKQHTSEPKPQTQNKSCQGLPTIASSPTMFYQVPWKGSNSSWVNVQTLRSTFEFPRVTNEQTAQAFED